MNIFVLIKQVPNTVKVKIDPVTHNLVRDGVESVLNPYDAYALETALQIKDRTKAHVSVLSMGPDQAKEVLFHALACGADDAYLLSDRAFAGADTLATSYTLAMGIQGAMKDLLESGLPDLILCGKQAIDGDTAQVPEELAGHLDIGCVTNVTHIDEVNPDAIIVTKTGEYGKIRMKVTYPGVLTVEKGSVTPRLPVIKDMIQAEEKPLTVLRRSDIDAEEERLSIAGSPTKVMKIFSPEKKKDTTFLNGTVEEQVEQLLQLLQEKGVIKDA